MDILEMKGLVGLHLEAVVPCRWESGHENLVSNERLTADETDALYVSFLVFYRW